ncbi:carbon-nitrogen hydrolase family protein [Guyparkeria sp.]|uniref:carbon-nitrogen hydrolase family protein n=1 Tax=Guyparkeria sp. TaxID=2035736 RepID=UPI003561E1DD
MSGTAERQPRVAVVQMNGRADWKGNRPVVEGLLGQAAVGGADVAVLPENLLAMPADPRDLVAMGRVDTSRAVEDLRDMARRTGMWLVAGTLPFAPDGEDDPDRVVPRTLVIAANGDIVAHYDKIHLFDVTLPDGQESYRESAVFRAGTEPVVVDTPAGRLGLATCFDLRFPELFRRLVDLGAEWFCLPSAFTQATGRAHWEVLLRARAIENGCWMAAAAQVGRHADGRQTWGHSMLVDPWGEVLADCGESPDTVAVATFDRQKRDRLSRTFPVRDLRRLR